ncbi:MAG: SIR2 family protein [Candidatus Gracilibacteria bacterium]
MGYKVKDLVILTGAGFTRNFGGFLGKDITAMIFNSPLVQTSDNLRKLMTDIPDFESAYFEVFNNKIYSQSERVNFQKAVEEAYKLLDDTIKHWVFDGKNEPNTYFLFGKLFTLLIGASNERGMFFTLNQDLFMERQCGYRPPGAARFPETFYGVGGRELESKDFVTLSDYEIEETVEREIESNAGSQYIKLHGSYGWLSNDGSHRMIVGKNKLDDINSIPLLKYYFEIFKRTILEGNKKKILIIGYGFQDPHINEVLLEGVEKHETKIFVINPSDLGSFVENLANSTPPCSKLLKGLGGYYPNVLKDILPPNQSFTPVFENLLKSLS